MQVYTTTDAINAQYGTSTEMSSPLSAKSIQEYDWGYRLRGQGLPGGGPGWLLTYHRHASATTGHLIAYEIDESDQKTGRVLMVRDNWTNDKDDQWHPQITRDSNWVAGDQKVVGKGEADIDWIDSLLP